MGLACSISTYSSNLGTPGHTGRLFLLLSKQAMKKMERGLGEWRRMYMNVIMYE
jgi:hypothetical protein